MFCLGTQTVSDINPIDHRYTAESDRNNVLHSRWGFRSYEDGKSTVIRTKYTAKRRKGLDFQREELTAADLKAMAHNISVASHEIAVFAGHLGIKTGYP